MAGGAIDPEEITMPEILDPRQVQGQHSKASVPGMFYEKHAGEAQSTAITRALSPNYGERLGP
jgi:hypothetical protein